jgi:hypothetical protein
MSLSMIRCWRLGDCDYLRSARAAGSKWPMDYSAYNGYAREIRFFSFQRFYTKYLKLKTEGNRSSYRTEHGEQNAL